MSCLCMFYNKVGVEFWKFVKYEKVKIQYERPHSVAKTSRQNISDRNSQLIVVVNFKHILRQTSVAQGSRYVVIFVTNTWHAGKKKLTQISFSWMRSRLRLATGPSIKVVANSMCYRRRRSAYSGQFCVTAVSGRSRSPTLNSYQLQSLMDIFLVVVCLIQI